MSSLIENKLPNIPSKSMSFNEMDTLRAKLRLSEVRYSQLSISFNSLKQQLLSNEITIKTLNSQVTNLKQSLSKQQLFHTKTVQYLNEEIKVRVKSQKVWIDYLKRENQFLKGKINSKVSESMMLNSDFERIEKNPINLLLWKIEEMAAERLVEESKFKKLLVPFFSALYKSKTTDELFEECIKLFKDCETYQSAISKGEKLESMIEEFQRQMNLIIGDQDPSVDL